MKISHRSFSLALPVLVLATGCSFNLFAPIDGPGENEEQLLSAARACFDNEDFECADEYYEKLTGTKYGELAASEQAFAILHKQGAGMKAFMKAVGGGDASGGSVLTSMASSIAAEGSPGTAARAEIFRAFQQINKITADVALRGLVRFITAFSLAAELLAEDIVGKTELTKADIASNAAACEAAGTFPACTANANCLKSSVIGPGATPGGTPFRLATAPSSTVIASATWGLFTAILDGVDFALSNELSASGKFSATQGFTAAVIASGFDNNDGCFRYLLLTNDVGN